MAKDNKTAYIILGLLHHENLSGYDIKKRIDTMICHFWGAGYGQIYPTLKQLVESQDIIKNEAESYKGPERIKYSITEKGKCRFNEWLIHFEPNHTVKHEILLKLFFGKSVTLEDNITMVQNFKFENLQKLDEISLYKSNLLSVLGNDQEHLYYYLTVLFGEKVYRAYLDWVEEALNLLQMED